MNVRAALSITGALLSSLALAPVAVATFPGDNGAIAFSRDGDIWSIDADGSGEKRLTSGSEHNDYSPEWSPDGRGLLFVRQGADGPHIYRMRADGTGVTWIGPGSDPQFSSDGRQIAYSSDAKVRVANADGSGATTVAGDDSFAGVDDWAPNHGLILWSIHDGDTIFSARSPAGVEMFWGQQLHDDRHLSNDSPSWSPDGTKIAFSTHLSGISPCVDDPTCPPNPDLGVRVMDIGAGGLRTVVPIGKPFEWLGGNAAAWSPDGKWIVFTNQGTLELVRADGTGRRALTKGAGADWQPVAHQAPPTPPPAPPRTVTVPVEVPGPVRVVEKVVTRLVQGDAARCAIPPAKRRLTLTLRATKAVRRGATAKVTVDLATKRATVRRGTPYRVWVP